MSSKFKIVSFILGGALLVAFVVVLPYVFTKSNNHEFYINGTEISLSEGNTYQLSLVSSENDDVHEYEFEVDDKNIAEVDENGNVIAKSEGTTTVHVKYKKDNSYKDVTIHVIKSENEIKVNNIKLEKITKSLTVGEELTIKYTIEPSNATNQIVSWISSDSSVVSVDQSGKIKAKKEGTAVITAQVGNKKDDCKIVVVGKNNTKIEDKVTLNKQSISLNLYEKYQLTATSNNKNVTYTWSSSNNDVASVSNNGLVTAKKAGSATITVATSNGKKATCTVTVVETKIDDSVTITKVTKVYTGNPIETSVASKSGSKITVTYYTDSGCKTKTDKKNAIQEGGAPKNVGVYYAIAKSEGNGTYKQFTTACTLALEIKKVEITSVKLNKTKVSLSINGTAKLVATLVPDSVKSDSLTWTSSNPAIVKVSNGSLTALQAGEATITVTTSNGKTAKCIVTVTNTKDTVTIKAVLAQYTGSTIPTVATTTSGSISEITYYTDSACKTKTPKTNATKVGGAPKDAGVYYAIAKASNGAVSQCTKALTISKAPDRSNVKSVKTANYNGKGVAAELTSPVTGIKSTVYYSDSSCKTKTTTDNAVKAGGAPKNGGTYYVIVTTKGDSNYLSTKSGCTKAVVINKISDKVKISLISKTYTGKGIATKATATSGSKVTVTYYSDSKCATKTTTKNGTSLGGTPKAVGTYYAIAKSAGNGNYKSATTKCTKAVVIEKKATRIKVATVNMGEYHCGSSSTNCKSTWKDFRDLFKKHNLDIVGTQETGSSIQDAGSGAGLKYSYIASQTSSNSILSKYELTGKTNSKLTSCAETRGIQKSIVKINGVKISVYNTHLGLNRNGKDCNTPHYEDIAKIIKSDPNPVILTGDFNATAITKFNKYLKPLGAVVASHDTTTNNLWNKKSYCDMVVIIPKGHITVVKGETINIFGKLTDHNMVVATLDIK